MKKRIDAMVQHPCDAYLITSRENKYYIAGLLSDRGYVIVCRHHRYIIVDGRYYTAMKEENKTDMVLLMDQNTLLKDHLNTIKEKEQLHTIGVENTMDIKTYEMLQSLISIPIKSNDFSLFRMKKNKKDLHYMKKACAIVDQTFLHVLDFIKIGMSENEVANEIEYTMKTLGANKVAFETIVVFGERGALPHGLPTERTLVYGDFVTIDFGAVYKAYCSDMTRTFQVGCVQNDEMNRLYDIVLEANKAAIRAIKPGRTCQKIDTIARDIICHYGYGNYFTHNLGHGIGIKCHEEPCFSPNDTTMLEEGMCFTVEPGIYIEGVGGVRIEDDIVVTNDGCEVLTKASKERLQVKTNGL